MLERSIKYQHKIDVESMNDKEVRERISIIKS